MNSFNPEHTSNSEFGDQDPDFLDKMRQLLPHTEFDETPEMLEIRTTILDALRDIDQDPHSLRAAWREYARICEQAVDAKHSDKGGWDTRAQLQIAVLVHKALIFREIGDNQRYYDELADAEVYAFNMHLDEISEALNAELDRQPSE